MRLDGMIRDTWTIGHVDIIKWILDKWILVGGRARWASCALDGGCRLKIIHRVLNIHRTVFVRRSRNMVQFMDMLRVARLPGRPGPLAVSRPLQRESRVCVCQTHKTKHTRTSSDHAGGPPGVSS